MFILKLLDRNGNEVNEGDIVKISDGKKFTFFAEVKYLEHEEIIAPFHTFSFHSFVKVDSVPDDATKCTEERYNCWFRVDAEEDEKAQDFERYLMSWRECEHHLEKRSYKIQRQC